MRIAVAGLESVFAGWSGLCTGTDECLVTLNQTEQVTATFTLNQYDLIVNTMGDGDGLVTSVPAGIDCGSNCHITVDYGTMITLTATAGTESQLKGGWAHVAEQGPVPLPSTNHSWSQPPLPC